MAVQEEELSFNDYVSILKRRWLTVLLTALVVTIAVIVVTLKLPLIFTSVGHITIESPIVDTLFERDGGGADVSIYVGERIDKIKKKTLSKKNLIAISKKYNLFPDLNEPKEIVKGVRDAISITYDKKSADGSEWGKKVTTGFVVEVEFSDAENAYNIANEIVTNLLNENTKDRSARATENTSFLTSQLKEIKAKLEAVENKVADFKQAHTDSLPEHQDMHMAMLEQLRASSENLDQAYKDTQEELRYLDVEYSTSAASAANGQDATTGQPVTLSPLEEAKAELRRSLVLYKDTHPTIRALKRKVALLEQSGESIESESDKKPNKNNMLSEIALVKIKTQIESANARLNSISKQKRLILADMHKVQQQVMKIPEVERGLTVLLRDYDNAKQKYEEIKSKQINAQIAEKLETQNKGERFILEASPEIPKNRTSPQRTKIVLIGTLVAMGIGIAVAFVLEFLEQRVRGLSRVTSIINMKPIAVIPHIDTNDEIAKRKKLFKYAYIAVAVLVSLIVIAVIVIFFVIPSK